MYSRSELGTVARPTWGRSRIAKFAIDDALWALIEPLLPARPPRQRRYAGRKPIPDRAVLTGILFVLRTGIPWNMLPPQMGWGSGSVCWRRLAAWQRAGVWQRIHETLLTELRRRGQLDLVRGIVDSASVRALQRGKKLDRTQPIAARRVPSTTSSRKPKAFRSSRG